MGMIQGAFSKPTNNSDDYLPTQVIAEYIRSLGYDGIRFNSSLHYGGVNLTIFNYENCEAVSSQDFRVEEMKISERIISIRSPKSGYINGVNAHALGELARQIGAGRYTKEDSIDHTVGIVLTRKKGDFVEVNDELARFYLSDKDVRLNDILNCFTIEELKTW